MTRTDFRPGAVLSFRIPENISPEDLEHLRHIAKRPTSGKTGPVSDFFFAKLLEDRIEQLRYVSVPLPDLMDEQVELLHNPVFKKALTLYAYQLLGRSVSEVAVTVAGTGNNPKPESADATEANKGSSHGPDPAALDLLRKLGGGS